MKPGTQWKVCCLSVAVLGAGALALLVLAVTGRQRNSAMPTLAEARAQAAASRRDLALALRTTKGADWVTQQAFLTNSALSRGIHSAGGALVRKFEERTVIATTEAQLAGLSAAATQCAQRYAEYNHAQVALAALTLSGFQQAAIRSTDAANRKEERDSYQILVPAEEVKAARAVLQDVHLSQMNFASAPSAVQAMQILKARGIQSTVRFLHGPDWTNSAERLFAVFVRSADAESTRRIVGLAAQGADF